MVLRTNGNQQQKHTRPFRAEKGKRLKVKKG
jgi:hypothetical protein